MYVILRSLAAGCAHLTMCAVSATGGDPVFLICNDLANDRKDQYKQ